MLPDPVARIVSVAASFATTESRSSVACTSSVPTTPLNGSGAPGGSGSTSMVTGFASTVVGTAVVPKSELRPKKSSKGSRPLRTLTWASTPMGSIVRRPGPVGISAARRMTAVVYCAPSRIRCSMRGWPSGVTSSTQKPAGSGTRVIPKRVTSTRVQMRYSTTSGSPS